MFEPQMELSDNFRYVIDHMFCCEEDDADIEQYVTEFIFDYFGLAYVTTIFLGGVAQQNIFMNREDRERLERQSIQIQHQARIAFDLSIKTVSTNPVIIKFKVRDIFSLFNKLRFPYDPLIQNKSKLIEKILDRYLNGTVYCYGKCGSDEGNGICESTGHFQFGTCKCTPGWTGVNCETRIEERPKILHGTICGFDRSFMRVNCGGMRPWEGCPTGWRQYNWPTDLTICYKNETVIDTPVYGNLCGLHSSHSKYNFDLNIGCGGITDIRNECPAEHQRRDDKTISCSRTNVRPSCAIAQNVVCAAMNTKEHLSGTLCGLQIQDTTTGPSCDGYDPGLRRCLPGYTLQRTAFSDYGFMVCVKN